MSIISNEINNNHKRTKKKIVSPARKRRKCFNDFNSIRFWDREREFSEKVLAICEFFGFNVREEHLTECQKRSLDKNFGEAIEEMFIMRPIGDGFDVNGKILVRKCFSFSGGRWRGAFYLIETEREGSGHFEEVVLPIAPASDKRKITFYGSGFVGEQICEDKPWESELNDPIRILNLILMANQFSGSHAELMCEAIEKLPIGQFVHGNDVPGADITYSPSFRRSMEHDVDFQIINADAISSVRLLEMQRIQFYALRLRRMRLAGDLPAAGEMEIQLPMPFKYVAMREYTYKWFARATSSLSVAFYKDGLFKIYSSQVLEGFDPRKFLLAVSNGYCDIGEEYEYAKCSFLNNTDTNDKSFELVKTFEFAYNLVFDWFMNRDDFKQYLKEDFDAPAPRTIEEDYARTLEKLAYMAEKTQSDIAFRAYLEDGFDPEDILA